jgi:hypothetical protein
MPNDNIDNNLDSLPVKAKLIFDNEFAAAPAPDFGGEEEAIDDDFLDDDVPKKKKMGQYIPMPNSKTPGPSQIQRELIFERAHKLPKPKHASVNSSTQCLHCGCQYNRHGSKEFNNCKHCGNCPGGFLYQEQVNRVYFTEFLRWCKRWVKASKKRDLKRLRQIWSRFRSTQRLHYCGTCDTPTIGNEMHGVVKRGEGLQCASCAQCSDCCKCVSCAQCTRRKHQKQLCKVCNVCNQCCQCRECPVCNRDCSYNYCGYALTDYNKKHNPGCGRCYKCCDCGDYRKVPFGSFAKPIFHKPTLMQHRVNPTSRYVAAEIEVATIYGSGKPIYNTVRKWGGATVGDGSLQPMGFEVNSAPAGGDLYAQQIEDVCAAIKLQKGVLDEKCGLHVHVDARDMNYYDIRRLVRVYAAIEDGLFAMVSPARIAGVTDDKGELHQYCQPCGKKYVAAIEEGRLPYDKIKADVITSVYSGPSTHVSGINLRTRKRHNQYIPRYNALNLHSWFYRGTIESRMFDGCIDAEPIIKWGIMWTMIIDYVVKSTDDQVAKDMVGKPLACLKKIVGDNNNIIDFIKARVLLFGNSAMQRDAKEIFKAL